MKGSKVKSTAKGQDAPALLDLDGCECAPLVLYCSPSHPGRLTPLGLSPSPPLPPLSFPLLPSLPSLPPLPRLLSSPLLPPPPPTPLSSSTGDSPATKASPASATPPMPSGPVSYGEADLLQPLTNQMSALSTTATTNNSTQQVICCEVLFRIYLYSRVQ